MPFSSFRQPYRSSNRGAEESHRSARTPGNRQPAPARAPAPVVDLDPALAAYAHAYAAAAKATNQSAANADVTAPTLDAQSLLESNPLLAAACGISRASQRSQTSASKCIPENFIIKSSSKDRDREKDRVSYYEFIHGCFRLLLLKLTEEHVPVDDLVKYFEALSGFATQYPWFAVYDLHQAITAEVEAGRRQWSDPIQFTFSYKFLSADTVLSARPAGGDGDRRSRRDGNRGPRHDSVRREHRADSRDHRDHRADSRDARREDKVRAPCDKYNHDAQGCSYGFSCKYLHVCSDCFKKGIELAHPAIWCIMKDEANKPSRK